MKLLSLTLSLLAATSATAFTPIAPQTSRPSTTTVFQVEKLSEIDEMCIENVAELCLKAEESLASECDLDEHEALVNQLEAQKDLLTKHLDHMDNLLHRLKGDGMEKAEAETTYFAG